MINLKKLAGGVAIVAMSAAFAPSAFAQITTSGVQGTVSNADGSPASDATVVVRDTRTGLSRSVVATASGAFDVRGLNVGGPYTVSVSAPGEQSTQVTDIFLDLGAPTAVDLQFSGATAGDVIVVTASQIGAAPVALGPAAVYSLETLESQPASNRDIKDIIRQDPRIALDFASGGGDGSNGVQCAGQHPRFNSLTVDGVRLSDDFGLNTNGYPTERIPFSYDSISQVSVELAPFDVQYGGFTACNINAVTKSGGNDFHGGAFFDFTNDSLYGDKTDGIQRNVGNFEEKRYGFHLGGPIIPDTLFFFTSYEKLEGANIFAATPADKGITQAQYDAIINIATNQYGYVAGGLPSSKAVEDEKFFAKLDWTINDRNRAAFTYTYNDGFNFSPSDNSATQLSDGNHYYEKGAEANAYTASLYSDWTDNFSTEARVSYLKLDNRQIPVAPSFGEVQINVGATTVYLGADDSRHSNKLNYDNLSYKLAGTYRLDNHTITGGYERQELDIFNLFLAETKGEWRFANTADFAAGNFSYYEYSNSVGTNNPDDAAASFGYGVNALYAQDEWAIDDKLTVVGGLRYEWYDTGDKPRFNQNFLNTYGFRNDETMDGRDLLQPRLGFTYDAAENVVVRGGIGLFSGGNPNVWLSNNYSNDGVSAADFICQVATTATPPVNRCNFPGIVTLANAAAPNLSDFTFVGDGRPFHNVAQEGIDFIAGASAVGSVNALDPDFKIPSQWKLALGTTIDFGADVPFLGHDWTLNADVLLAQAQEAANVIPLGYTVSRTAADGRPIYAGNTRDFLLTNTEKKPFSQVLSATLHNETDYGFDWTVGYAWTNARDVNPMTSSVAFSNFANYTTYDPVDPSLATSDYENTHRFTLNMNYDFEWAPGWETRVSLFGTVSEGAPYSYTVGSTTFGNTSLIEGPNSNSRQLAYIPTSATDPVISPTSNQAALTALMAYINSSEKLSGLKGGIAPRNIATDDWFAKFDLKISQKFPGLGLMGMDDGFEGFVMIENLGNLLNDSWGIQREHGFPGNAVLYGISGIDPQGRYVVSAFNPNVDRDSIIANASLWNVRVGVKYDF